jgi:type I restriction enzyme S subunit
MSFPKYQRYKDSGVNWIGSVPDHWNVLPLKRHSRLLTNKTDRRSFPVALENVESWTGRYVPSDSEFEGEGVAFEKGDILFGKLRPYLAKALVASRAGEAIGDFLVLRPDDRVVSRFTAYQILSREFISIVDGATFGTKMPRASWEIVGGMVLPLPSPAEQSAIVDFLDRETAKIDVLVAEQEKLIERLEEKRQAVISHAVTKGLNPAAPMQDSGVEWLGRVPTHWKVKSIRYILNAIGDVDHFMPVSVESGVPYLMTGDLKDFVSEVRLEECKKVSRQDFVQLSKKIRTSKGDVVMARYATIGTSMYVDLDLDILVSYSCVTLKTNLSQMSGMYLFQYMKSDPFRQGIEHQVNTNTQGNVGITDLQGLKIAVPPIDEQAAIVTFLQHETAKIDRLIGEANSAIALLQERRSALISAAVTGQIDVRQLVAA